MPTQPNHELLSHLLFDVRELRRALTASVTTDIPTTTAATQLSVDCIGILSEYTGEFNDILLRDITDCVTAVTDSKTQLITTVAALSRKLEFAIQDAKPAPQLRRPRDEPVHTPVS